METGDAGADYASCGSCRSNWSSRRHDTGAAGGTDALGGTRVREVLELRLQDVLPAIHVWPFTAAN